MSRCTHELVTVLSRDEGDGDPRFPIVMCPHCQTRWIGHVEEPLAKPLRGPSLFSDAARDALLIGQDRRALRLILEEHDLVPRVTRPTACLPMTTEGMEGGLVVPGQTCQISRRPQCARFRGTHLLIRPDEAARFAVVDLVVGNRSQTLQSASIPGVRFACDLRGAVVLSPGVQAMAAVLSVDVDAPHHVDLTPFAWEMDVAQTGMDIRLYVRNISDAPSSFNAWILGISETFTPPRRPLSTSELQALRDTDPDLFDPPDLSTENPA